MQFTPRKHRDHDQRPKRAKEFPSYCSETIPFQYGLLTDPVQRQQGSNLEPEPKALWSLGPGLIII